MKQYFALQYKFACRKLIDLGINPLLGTILGLIAFVLFSEFLYLKSEFAKYVMILVSMSLVLNNFDFKRLEFLQIVFGNNFAKQLRILENLIICIPFLFILLFHQNYIEGISIIIGAILIAFFSIENKTSFTLKTPFYKYPFEFSVGFRNSFFVIPLAYLLTFTAIYVDNFNLGIFSFFIVFLMSITFYLKPENEFFVWVYSTSPQKFLLHKMKIASFYTMLIAMPIILALSFFYLSQFYVLMIFFSIGFVLLWTIILAKYSVYPKEMNLIEGFLIALSIYMPIILVFVLPYFYFKSIRKLNKFLK